MRIRQRAEGDVTVMEVEGDLTVEHAGELVDALRKVLSSEARRIELDLSGVEAADIPSLQLFCATHKSALAKGVDIMIRAISSSIRNLAQATGFMEHEGCVPDNKRACLWLCQIEKKAK